MWGRCLCASISIVSRGASAVCCGSGRSVGIGGGDRFFVGLGVVFSAVLLELALFVSVV